MSKNVKKKTVEGFQRKSEKVKTPFWRREKGFRSQNNGPLLCINHNQNSKFQHPAIFPFRDIRFTVTHKNWPFSKNRSFPGDTKREFPLSSITRSWHELRSMVRSDEGHWRLLINRLSSTDKSRKPLHILSHWTLNFSFIFCTVWYYVN